MPDYDKPHQLCPWCNTGIVMILEGFDRDGNSLWNGYCSNCGGSYTREYKGDYVNFMSFKFDERIQQWKTNQQ